MTSTKCMDWLRGQYERSRNYQTARGIQFDLKLSEYINLWSPKRLRRLDELVHDGTIDAFQKHRQWAWVLTWRSKEDRLYGVMNAATAVIATRAESEKKFYLKKGEKHSEKTKKAIGAKHRGKKISKEHRKAIGDSKRGKQQTPEQIAKRVEASRQTRLNKQHAALAAGTQAPSGGQPHAY